MNVFTGHNTSSKKKRIALIMVFSSIILIISIPIFSTLISRWQKNTADSLQIASFKKQNVDVKVEVVYIHDEEYKISAHFTPLPGYHLYAKSIPENGIDGVGRPTKFDVFVTPTSQLILSHVSQESLQPINFIDSSLSSPIAVYPSGPVEIFYRATGKIPAERLQVTMKFSYMSCKEGYGCTIPVKDYMLMVFIYPNSTQ